ncbi:hypothetical protein GLE_3208 [Lysobacter enzymogenes]|uniref:Uncharacterized protein n=1 Tax=Lysobacter enzymogenes TaxID=69 RepID=A0A0S2DJ30_LYSEN|nr:hypothetical protein GLE_3208 [Lysobacter enzymogenes]
MDGAGAAGKGAVTTPAAVGASAIAMAASRLAPFLQSDLVPRLAL